MKAKKLLHKLKRNTAIVGGYFDLKTMAENTGMTEDDVRVKLAGNYNYIPIVRMNGRFIGGYSELEKVAKKIEEKK